MKKYLLIILLITSVCYYGCKKDPANNGPSSANSYMPVTPGSNWTYINSSQGFTDTVNVTMNSATTAVNGKTYFTANTLSKKTGSNAVYFYEANHLFALRSFNVYTNTILELQLYNDTATVNSRWIYIPVDGGLIDSQPVRAISTIEQKDETKLFAGKTFNNVIHTEVDIQYDFGSGFVTSYIYDYYLARGIGVLGYNLRALGSNVVETQGISTWTVK
jgi:hypothetical protein